MMASTRELVLAIITVAVVGGLVAIGVEHGVAVLWHHVVVGWR